MTITNSKSSPKTLVITERFPKLKIVGQDPKTHLVLIADDKDTATWCKLKAMKGVSA